MYEYATKRFECLEILELALNLFKRFSALSLVRSSFDLLDRASALEIAIKFSPGSVCVLLVSSLDRSFLHRSLGFLSVVASRLDFEDRRCTYDDLFVHDAALFPFSKDELLSSS